MTDKDKDDRPDCLKPMTEEELANFKPITKEEIEEALRKGAEEVEAQRGSGFPIMPYSPFWNPRPGPYFK